MILTTANRPRPAQASIDIQAMGEGEAKTAATKEMEAAQQLMAKNDVEGCKSHIHSAMEATEQ